MEYINHNKYNREWKCHAVKWDACPPFLIPAVSEFRWKIAILVLSFDGETNWQTQIVLLCLYTIQSHAYIHTIRGVYGWCYYRSPPLPRTIICVHGFAFALKITILHFLSIYPFKYILRVLLEYTTQGIFNYFLGLNVFIAQSHIYSQIYSLTHDFILFLIFFKIKVIAYFGW